MRIVILLQITFKDKEIGAPDDVGLETFKKGAVLQEEEQKHAEPHAQWEALTACIRDGASVSHTAAVMREICDAVDHEISKEVLSLSLSLHLSLSMWVRCLILSCLLTVYMGRKHGSWVLMVVARSGAVRLVLLAFEASAGIIMLQCSALHTVMTEELQGEN